jgi:phosphomannomutase
MRESGALFGAALGRRYFFRELEGGDDCFHTACRLIAFLGQKGKSLSQCRRECPAMYITPGIRLKMPLADQSGVIGAIQAAWKSFPQQTLDGLRIDTPAGWILVRGGDAESFLTFRFESLDWPALDDLVERFCDALPKKGDELRRNYVVAMGRE